jgi:D-alanyl-D-alanine endopeptidase (penicillin-binding protein 7)
VQHHKQVGFKWLLAVTVAAAVALLPATLTHAAGKAKPAKESRATKAKIAKSAKATKAAKVQRTARRPLKKVAVIVEQARPSFGHLYGLQKTDDALELKSSVALVVDQDTDEVLFSKNPQAVLPIASITKLMTALVVTEAGLSLDESLTVTQEDVDATTGSSSRLSVGTRLTRGEMLHLSLMSSENRAAHVLGRTYPGGIQAFIPAMNHKALALGMGDTRYVEPTGLSSDNQSSAKDLTLLVKAAFHHPIIRDLSTSQEAMVPVGARQLQFRNTNGLVRNPEWEIGLQKTGYISAAGRCVVMQAQLAGRKLIMVLLDSAGKYSRVGDAERIRKWLASSPLASQALNPQAVTGPLVQPVELVKLR